MQDTGAGYRHIVVALDGGDESWAALREAIRLARTAHAALDLLVAVPPGAAPSVLEAHHAIARDAMARTRRLPATSYVVEGDPDSAIVEHADSHGCDLIVMGCRSGLGPGGPPTDSITTAVSQRARIPVLIVRNLGDDADTAARAATRS